MADPRYYQVELLAADVPTARAAAAQILRRCGEPPVEADVEARLSLRTVTAVAALFGGRGTVEVNLNTTAEQLSSLTSLVRDPNLSWHARQSRSRFGSSIWVESAYPYEPDPLVTLLSLSFDGPTGRERDQRPRVERWLAARVEADLLPTQASPRRLADAFFTATALRPGREPPRGRLPALECEGVRLRMPAYRADAGATQHYGPCHIEVEVPVPPGDAFARALALWCGGETIDFCGYFGCHAATAARWAGADVSQFNLHLDEADPRDVEVLFDAMTETDAAAVEWSCGWPGGGRYLSGLVLYANADGGPDDEPLSAPGCATLHLSVSPRVNNRNPDAFAARLAGQAGVMLVP
jgi:hypothetical protein